MSLGVTLLLSLFKQIKCSMFVFRAHDKPNLVLSYSLAKVPLMGHFFNTSKKWLVIPIMLVSLLHKWVGPSFQKVASIA